MKLEAFKAFVFDLDGTLIDSERYHAQAFSDAVLAQSGYRLSTSERSEFFGSHSTHFTEILNERHGLKMDPLEILKAKRMRVPEIFSADLFSGARDFLEMWHGRIPMALATNSPRSFVLPALEQSDLLRFFEHVITADEVVCRKPDPEIVERTVQRLRSEPEHTLVFEDQLIGIQAAQAANCQVVAVDNGQSVAFPATVSVCTWPELLNRAR